ncbi:MAG TPA: hypothetical protein V6C81_16740 [Planktothrix sp.]|jgi:hypothetical protein
MKALNSKQKFGLWLGIAMAIGIGINPPWIEGGPGGAAGPYAPIYAPPPSQPGHAPMQIDYSRVLMQWAMAAFVSVGLVLSGQAKEEQGEKKTAARSQQTSTPPGTVVQSQPAVAIDVEDARYLKFKESQPIGEIMIESSEDPDYWDHLAEAKGRVELPAKGRIQLEVRKDSAVDLGVLGRPEMIEIVSVDASDSQVTDDDVNFIASLKHLKELDLSNTQVTNAALKHIGRLRELERLWLDGTKVTAEGLSELKNLSQLQKVSLADTAISDDNVISLKEATQCQFVFTHEA